MISNPKVVITDYDYGDLEIEKAILHGVGAEVIPLQAKCEEDLFEVAEDCFGMINQYARVGRETIRRMKQCKVIARYGVGVDIVDVDAATERGILVTNVQDYCTEEVADHSIALWLTLARKLPRYDKATRSGVWNWQTGAPVFRIRGRVMGIVSFGKIGQAIAERARGFGVELMVYDPYISQSSIEKMGCRPVNKETLIRESDFLMMQAPMTEETHHFLSFDEFKLMKSNAIVINTGRGPTIDNKALYQALTQQEIAAAGLDDPEEEPAKRSSWDPQDNPIFSLPNVLVTPHAAYYSEESIRIARETAATQVAKMIRGEVPDYPVNPEVLNRQQN